MTAIVSAVGLTVLYQSMLCCDPCVLLKLHTVTHFNSPAVTKVDTYYEYSLKENWKTNTVVYEMNNFIDIFQVNIAEEKRPNFKTSYLSFYCEFKAISNTRLKSRICFDRL